MGGTGGKTGNELLLLGKHLLLPFITGLELLAANLTFPQIEVVVAAIGGCRTIAYLNDPRNNSVHKVPVVTGHQQGTLESCRQPFFKPED